MRHRPPGGAWDRERAQQQEMSPTMRRHVRFSELFTDYAQFCVDQAPPKQRKKVRAALNNEYIQLSNQLNRAEFAGSGRDPIVMFENWSRDTGKSHPGLVQLDPADQARGLGESNNKGGVDIRRAMQTGLPQPSGSGIASMNPNPPHTPAPAQRYIPYTRVGPESVPAEIWTKLPGYVRDHWPSMSASLRAIYLNSVKKADPQAAALAQH